MNLEPKHASDTGMPCCASQFVEKLVPGGTIFCKILSFSERNFSRGLRRATFERSVRHVVTQRLWWPSSVADVIIHEYTDWGRVEDPVANRHGYVQVNAHRHAHTRTHIHTVQNKFAYTEIRLHWTKCVVCLSLCLSVSLIHNFWTQESSPARDFCAGALHLGRD